MSAGAGRVNVQALRLEAGAMRTSHWWAEHAEALAALLDVAEAAQDVGIDIRKAQANADRGEKAAASVFFPIKKDLCESLVTALARLDFGDTP